MASSPARAAWCRRPTRPCTWPSAAAATRSDSTGSEKSWGRSPGFPLESPRLPTLPPRPSMSELAHRRILLKLSGEALMGSEDYGIDPAMINRIAGEVMEARQAGAEVALVIGGGNIFRGAGLAAGGMDRVTGDQMGMLATVINALAMQDALEKLGGKVRVMSAIKINDVCEDYIRRR